MRYFSGLLLAVLALASAAGGPVRSDEILVSAASSLSEALGDVGAAYTSAHPGTVVRMNFGSSGLLERQIRQGAPVDVFCAASPQEIEALRRSGHLQAGAIVEFAGNRLVLIAPKGSPLRSWSDLASSGIRRIALSDPDSVPSGRYARQTLAKRGLWETVRRKAVFGQNVRQTLTYVARHDADAGVVFRTDALHDQAKVRIVAEASPRIDHEPIVYLAAAVKGAPNRPGAASFTQFLRGRIARAIFTRYGFLPPAPGKTGKR